MDIMIDLETLGVSPGCVVMSIGAVRFDKTALYETFTRNISVVSCVEYGLKIDPKTLEFWMLQSNFKEMTVNAFPLPDVLDRFSTFFSETNNSPKVWSHGAGFDIPILEAAYKAYGIQHPWGHRAARDTRTLYALAGIEPPRTGGHNALADAIEQAATAVEAFKKLGL